MTYEVIDGLAIYQGDMVLGTDKELSRPPKQPERGKDAPKESSSLASRQQYVILREGRKYLWPGGIIPYTIDGKIDDTMNDRIKAAIAMIKNGTNLRLRSRNGEDDYVVFHTTEKNCSAEVGKQGGSQNIKLSDDCGVGNIVHEILHAAGLWHEQSRNDRDTFIRILWNNILSDKKHNFEKHDADGIDIGRYDYNSIMHYGPTFFGKDDSHTGDKLTTIEVLKPNVQVGQRSSMSKRDIAGVNALYPVTVTHVGGEKWGAENYATFIAFGDVDGDGRDEIGITRKTDQNNRYWVLDDAKEKYRVLVSGGDGWGSDNYATSIAFGDVDGDGLDEFGITRKSDQNERYWVFDDAKAGFRQLLSGGSSWGDGNYATSIAFGDVDNDGREEVGVARKTDQNDRYWLLDDAKHDFRVIDSGGKDWGSDNYATAIAFGDVDGNKRDEIGIARKTRDNARYYILKLQEGQLNTLHSGGHRWGGDNFATSIAFGDVDGDGRDEVGVARMTTDNDRYYILDDHKHQFRQIHAGGDRWGTGNYATSISFGDVDGDGSDEVGITRNSDTNDRYWVLDDGKNFFLTIEAGGRNWGASNYATAIAFGDVDGDGDADFGVTRFARQNQRYVVYEMNK